MATIQDVVDQARRDLLHDNKPDDTKRRYPNADLVRFINQGLLRTRDLRPDLWIGTFSTPWVDLAIGGTFPLPAQYVPALAYYAAYRAELRDDEYGVKGKAGEFLKLFERDMGVAR